MSLSKLWKSVSEKAWKFWWFFIFPEKFKISCRPLRCLAERQNQQNCPVFWKHSFISFLLTYIKWRFYFITKLQSYFFILGIRERVTRIWDIYFNELEVPLMPVDCSTYYNPNSIDTGIFIANMHKKF